MDNKDKLLTREEAAKYLGVAKTTLANWHVSKKRNITVVKIGRLVKYKLSDLDAFIEKGVCKYE